MDNSKIKIEVNGYTIYANSIEEARALIGAIPTHQVPTKKNVDLRHFNGGNNERPMKIPKVRPDGVVYNGTGNRWEKMVADRKAKKAALLEKKNRKPRKSTPGARWEPAEVQYILDNLEQGSSAVCNSKNLLARHSRMGIQQMYWKSKKNPLSYKVRPEVQALIDAYHKAHPEVAASKNIVVRSKPGMFSSISTEE